MTAVNVQVIRKYFATHLKDGNNFINNFDINYVKHISNVMSYHSIINKFSDVTCLELISAFKFTFNAKQIA